MAKHPVYLGSKWVESRDHAQRSKLVAGWPTYWPIMVIDGPYESFEYLKDFDGIPSSVGDVKGEEVWTQKWVVRYNDNRIELLDEGYFESWLEPALRTVGD